MAERDFVVAAPFGVRHDVPSGSGPDGSWAAGDRSRSACRMPGGAPDGAGHQVDQIGDEKQYADGHQVERTVDGRADDDQSDPAMSRVGKRTMTGRLLGGTTGSARSPGYGGT